VLVANRTPGRAEALAASMGVEAAAWGDLPLAEVDLLVNATSVGLQGAETPVDAGALARAAQGRLRSVFDAVYRRGSTELVRLARAAGLEAGDGLPMLVYQAAEAYVLFFSSPAPVEVMLRAARDVA
jgi:shikimate dehydrogenase